MNIKYYILMILLSVSINNAAYGYLQSNLLQKARTFLNIFHNFDERLLNFKALNNENTKDSNNIIKRIKDQNVKYIMFTFCDITGALKELTLPIDSAIDAVKEGIAFDGSSIKGYSSLSDSDLLLKPDGNTFRILPWLDDEDKTAWLICDIYKDQDTILESSPRALLKKNTQDIKDKYNYKFNIGPEIEFFLIDKDSQKAIDDQDYFSPVINSKLYNIKLDILKTLKKLNIPVEKIHHEVSSGQYEVSLHYSDALTVADQIIVTKYALKIIASKYNFNITFMPKPYENQNGSGMHLHYSLYDINNRKNVFFDSTSDDNLSKEANSFIAGNLKYIRELTILFNPTVNSYKRLVPGHEAPIYIAYGQSNRSTLIRKPLPGTNIIQSTRVELRCPDSMCNPYLALSGLLYTGMKGINDNLDKPIEVKQNLYKLTFQEVKDMGIEALPHNLNIAIRLLEKSKIAQELLSSKIHKYLLYSKYKEYMDYNNYITNWEREQYLYNYI